MSGPAYSEGTDLSLLLKTKQFSLLIIVWLDWNRRPSGERRGPTEEVRQSVRFFVNLGLGLVFMVC